MFISTTGKNNNDVLQMNQALVVQYLQINGVSTRAQMSKELGLTQASLSKITAALISNGIVEETGFISGEKGRRSVGVALSSEKNKVIGIKLSRRYFSVGVFNLSGVAYDGQTQNFTIDNTSDEIFDRIKTAVDEYLKRNDNVVAIGVAVPGPYQKNSGRILLMTEMKDWENIHLKDKFETMFELPVIVGHDANQGALANWWLNANMKRRKGTLVHFLVGEGVGAGVIVDGQVLTGDQGIAGEIGHISIDVNGERCACGNCGCLEIYCSSIAFVKHANEQLAGHPYSMLNRFPSLTTDNIFNAAQMDDPLAVDLVKRAGRYIGYGVVTLINAYDPSTIVISDLMAKGGDILLNEVNAVVRDRVIKSVSESISIELSKELNDSILVGAAAAAIHYCLERPAILSVKK